MASQVPAKKNTAFNLGLSLYLNTGALVTNPGTITAKISKDFGDYADVGTVSKEDSTYGQIKLALTTTEMNADVVMIYVVDNTSGCVPFTCTIYTAANLLDDVKTDTANNYAILNHADYGNSKLVRSTTPANTLTVDAAHLVAVPDTQKVDIETIKTRAVTCAAGVTVLASVGTAATSTAQTGDCYAIVNGDHGLVSIQDDVDTIKAKTDSLTFTVANQVDANIQAINDTAVTGNGGVTPWGPA